MQTVTLTDPTASTLIVETEDGDTRVFYDLTDLVDQYVPAHAQNAIAATISGDEYAKGRVMGANDVLISIMQSASVLRLEHETGLEDRD